MRNILMCFYISAAKKDNSNLTLKALEAKTNELSMKLDNIKLDLENLGKLLICIDC